MKLNNKKITGLSVASAITLMASNVLPLFNLLTFAESTTKDSIGSVNMEDDGVAIGLDETQTQKTTYSEEIEMEGTQNAKVYVSQASTFGVFIPKILTLDGKKNDENINKSNYVVTISSESNFSGSEKILVVPDTSFKMSQLGKNDIDVTITQDKQEWLHNEIDTKGNGEVSATGMSAGSWKGSFNFNIKLESENENANTPTTLEAGLYDVNGIMLASWEESGIDVEQDYTYSNYKTTETAPYYVLNEKYPTTTTIILPKETTKIGDYALFSCTNLTSIEIPENITNIGYFAFSNCSNLTNVILPKNITNIGISAFQDCKNLTSIELPNSITKIEESTFFGCSKLNNVIIPESVNSIERRAFRNCINLTNIEIPKNVNNIGEEVFANCKNMNSIKVVHENPTYDSRNNCNAIIETATNKLIRGSNNTIIPNDITTIGDYAFDNLINITNMEIPNSVTTIGEYTFYRCINLDSIEIPNSVTTMGASTFWGCEKLKSVKLSSNLTDIRRYTFYECISLTSIEIPENILTIGNNSFKNCTNLSNITIPNSLTAIYDSAFENCSSLTKITIPQNVKNISSNTFKGCTNLKNVTFIDTTTQWYIGYSYTAQKETLNNADLKDSTLAATYLTINYVENQWTKGPLL